MQNAHRRLTAGRAVGQSFSLLGRNFGVVISVSLLLIALPTLITGLISSASTNAMVQSIQQFGEWPFDFSYGYGYGYDASWNQLENIYSVFGGMGFMLLFSLASAIVLQPLAIGALVVIFSRSLIGKQTDFTLAMRFSGKRLGRLIVLSLCWVACGIVLGLALMVVIVILSLVIGLMVAAAGAVGIFLAVILGLAIVAVCIAGITIVSMAMMLSYSTAMNENIWHFNAVIRGFALAFKRFWSTLGANMLIYLIVFGVIMVLSLLLLPVVFMTGGDGIMATMIIYTLFMGCLAALSMVLYSALGVQYYFSIRSEFEGWQPMTVIATPTQEEVTAAQSAVDISPAEEAPVPDETLQAAGPDDRQNENLPETQEPEPTPEE